MMVIIPSPTLDLPRCVFYVPGTEAFVANKLH